MSPASRAGSPLQQGSGFQVLGYQIPEIQSNKEISWGLQITGWHTVSLVIPDTPVSSRTSSWLCVDSSALDKNQLIFILQ